MGYRNLRACVDDLQRNGHLIVWDEEIDPHLEMAEIQRRVYASSGPAILFTCVKDCRFPMLGNLFGSIERARFIFRDTLETVRRLIELKIDPNQLLKKPFRYASAPFGALRMLPKRVGSGAIFANEAKLTELPKLVSWPDDGGPYVTLPQVYTEHPHHGGLSHSNLGMYRVQLAGNEYNPLSEVGLHYQIHRGIGVHHAAAIAKGEPLKVNIFVGGNPAMTLAAVMPLPEGLSELGFAGALAGHRIAMATGKTSLPVYAEADFCISGTIHAGEEKPEGPFGDHLGYYSLKHLFPMLRVEKVFHRDGAIWPFTVVGRPPQEDTTFGQLIHEITGPVIPTVLPGVKEVHAVDAAGVHPLLLAIGSERYVPYEERRRPKELMTQAAAILGQGQMSLAKYLWIAAEQDDPQLNLHEIAHFLMHMLRRVDWRRDIHFLTETTIDTLDYSSGEMNHGSKAIIAAVGSPIRELPTEIPSDLKLPDGFHTPKLALPGVLVVEGPAYRAAHREMEPEIERFVSTLGPSDPINAFPLVVVVDDSQFTAQTVNNLLWVAFTRSNPAADVHGIGSFTRQKHWGCEGALVIDARLKPWNAPPLIEDPAVTAKVDALAAQGGALAKYL
ncbi:UbiD family decarboxylase [Blastopirellula marina]|uniref:3-octaprenyl-4-hydroxybenzoate carboxy-lyase n=1 Tax=Blastopirellula marina TaxID=124 RepID=A0A2S8G286_9BACT|nr:UbiD family decarboxylase [Blastopirellula marina]PQO38533.1 3-octaprenyl-4-hydroxybenzoate carboxy-lyase [Blastopirellula marina]PTL45190.1 UbiD family decarboxylase [Blastopirellula marina]